jgi:hypothetical protein
MWPDPKRYQFRVLDPTQDPKEPTRWTRDGSDPYNFDGGTYFFSSAQDPSENTSVYSSTDRFALAIFIHSAPTLLAYGGTYVNNVEMKVENILPFAFPLSIGGPKVNRRVKVSLELCI